MSKKDSPVTKLLWVDLEMTGLDVTKEVIIGAAARITDLDLNPIAPTYHSVIKQPQKFIDSMDEWNTNQHGKSGLTEKVPYGKDPEIAEQELIDYVSEYFGDEKAILSGNSISSDKVFIDKYWPKLSKKLHYRMLDVTAWKILFENKYKIKHKKQDCHRATDDILESIAELKTYIGHLKL